MNDKTGKRYEGLTQTVFQAIVNQDAVRTISVQRNITLQGKGKLKHKIDVYWKYEIGDVAYETIVEAKDWKTSVDKGRMRQFRDVLKDLPNQPKGIFVSRGGYQKGARDLAIEEGILIYELREADAPPSVTLSGTGWGQIKLVSMPFDGVISIGDEPISNNLYALGFEIDVFNPGYSNINVDVSQSWLQSEYPHLDVSAVNKIEVPHGVSDLYNEHGDVVNNLFTVLQAIAKDLAAKGAKEKREINVFEQPTFVMTGLPMFPRLKINSAAADVSIEHTRETRRAQMSSFGQWIFRNIKFGNTRLFLSTPSVGTWLPTKNQSASYLTREHPLSCSINFLVDGKDVTIFADITLPSPQPLPLLDAVGKDVEGK